MKSDAHFYDKQYEELAVDNSKMLDHAWYRPLMRFSTGRNEVVARCLKQEGKKYEQVIDLGCGAGGLWPLIQSFCKDYTGFDVSNYNIQKAQQLYPQGRFIIADFNHKLEIADASADLVLSVSTIEYLFDPEAFVSEIHRIVKPGGRLIIHTMNLAFILRRLQLLFGKLPTFNNAAGWQGGVLHNFTLPTFKTLLQAQGFQIQSFSCSGIWPGLRRKMFPNLLCGDMIFCCVKNQ